MAFLNNQFTERILFSIVVIGLLLGLYGGYKIVDTSMQLSRNLAQKIHDSGEELNVQSTAEGHGIMASDLERRELIKERGQMIMMAGIGVILLGVAWLGYDLGNNRRKEEKESPLTTEASETG